MTLINMAMATILLCASMAYGQDDDRFVFNRAKIPSTGAAVTAFVPPGWKIEEEVAGDLNNDRRPDIALCLVQDLPGEDDDEKGVERYRGLVILFRQGDGSLHRAAVAPTLLRCTMCNGTLSSPHANGGLVTITGGILVASQLYGSREATGMTQRFRYDGKTRRFHLIGEDISNFDRLGGDFTTISSNYLTGRQIVETGRMDEENGDRMVRRKTTRRVAKKRLAIEQIDYERY